MNKVGREAPWYRKYLSAQNGITLLIGVGLVGIASLLPGPWQPWTASIGLSFAGAALLDWRRSLAKVTVVDQVAQRFGLHESIEKAGISAVRFEMDQAFFRGFEQAHTIDIQVNTGSMLFHNYQHTIIEAVRSKGARVRIIMTDPSVLERLDATGPGVRECLGFKVDPGVEARQCRQLIDAMITEAGPAHRGEIEVQYLPHPPAGALVIIDNRWARYVPYETGVASNNSPSWDFDRSLGSAGVDHYIQMFESTWKWLSALNAAPPEVMIGAQD